MTVNSPQPNMWCVITLCVCLSILYDQYFPFLDFVVLFVVVIVAFIVFGNHLLVMDWSVVIPLGTTICLPYRGAGVVGVSFVRILPLTIFYLRRAHSHGELHIWKGLICRNLSGYHYLPLRREEQVLVECNFQSVLCVTFTSFSSSPLSSLCSYLSGISIQESMGRLQSLWEISSASWRKERSWVELS